jgi:hypothetical protein
LKNQILMENGRWSRHPGPSLWLKEIPFTTTGCDELRPMLLLGGFNALERRIKTMGKNQHVVRRGSDWIVKGEGNSRATSVHDTQSKAAAAGREIARNQGSELFVHGRDNRIRERDSFGNDPFPPKG